MYQYVCGILNLNKIHKIYIENERKRERFKFLQSLSTILLFTDWNFLPLLKHSD